MSRSNFIDETNNIYGSLKVIKPIRRPEDKKTKWYCECTCGNSIICSGSELRTGKRTSCGKHCNNYKNEEGKTYGFLKVLKRDETPPSCFADKTVHWICKCLNCGNIKSISGKNLRNGDTQSCGCIKSLGEKYILNYLIKNNYNYVYQKTFDDLIGNSLPLSFDFAILNDNQQIEFLIEFQGEQHFKENSFFRDTLSLRQEYDLKKINYCKNNNISILYINVEINKKPQFNSIEKIIKNFEENLYDGKISSECI